MKFTLTLLWGAIKIEWTRDAVKPAKPTVADECNAALTKLNKPAYLNMYRDDPKMCELLKGKV